MINKAILPLALFFSAVNTFGQTAADGASMAAPAADSAAVAKFPLLYKDGSAFETDVENLNYEPLISKLKSQIAAAKRKRKDVTSLQETLRKCNASMVYLKGTDRVTVVDSVVVDKDDLLEAYDFSGELGEISFADGKETTKFKTERGGKVYTSVRMGEDSVKTLTLVSYYEDGGETEKPQPLNGLDIEGDANYPFMMTDGITLYFAARDEGGLGNYDLYASRYDSDNDCFYKAENLGFPYNSYANDYLLVIDESSKVGWFASDRYQPEGKVCVYMFVPNASRNPYDYENSDPAHIRRVASLKSISSTWSEDNKQERIRARQTLSRMENEREEGGKADFTLVINDMYTYTKFSQFQSAAARGECEKWLATKAEHDSSAARLAALRDRYHSLKGKADSALKSQILGLETEVEELYSKVRQLEKSTRNLELSGGKKTM